MVLTGGKRGYAHTGPSPSPEVEADGQDTGLRRNDGDTEAEGHKGKWFGVGPLPTRQDGAQGQARSTEPRERGTARGPVKGWEGVCRP